ncbi:MAG: bifunctional 3-deoxy-7-phosphoheptulonate synthase/chorismate mutase type II [Sphingobacteriales bacterium]|nr:MAG: bifunctional 3-deoxy-7-phosphoheptulonate synthase/chorismate mutase type II [Sphingobacteriales bacterium]
MSDLNIVPLKDWGFNFKKPLIISGPCSCETEEQMMETAKRLADKGVDVLRAGIWKPRTRPGMFEGIGKEGLSWLVNAGKEIGKPVAVEVATAQHVQDCLELGVDILWLGARTTVNPFSVQEVADALKGVDIPVLVKNPINPDLQLWLGSMERVNKVGIKRLGAIHRGFSSYEKSKYRNKPMWELPVELRRLYPDMPIIVDPSHICGGRELIPSVAQKALDLDFDGLMIESHRDPDNAWSDASQQVTPERLGEILTNLVVRHSKLDDYEEDKLDALRAKIDRIDNYLLEIMGERMEIAKAIGEFKRDNGITILQSNRWDEIVNDRISKGAKKELTEDFVKELFEAVHQESIRHQTKVMNNILAE